MTPFPDRPLPRLRSTALLPALVGAALLLATAAQAAMYKCRTADGRTEYSDRRCPDAPDTRPWQPKNPLNTVSSESLTGKPKETKDERPAWLRGPDPIGDCKRKGGTIDPELRACRLP